MLLDQRTQFDSELAQLRIRLRELIEGDVVVGLRAMARARRAVRECEAQKNETDRLIAALDQRFSAV
ncbi:hypothetical protein DVS77_12085 [Mycolicibacterium moriokaense]|nr:hypothetical protein DVS77_12085 [Mycolicibacterium moriokaense]